MNEEHFHLCGVWRFTFTVHPQRQLGGGELRAMIWPPLWYGLQLSLCLVQRTLISQPWRMLWLLPCVTVFKEAVPLGAVTGDGMKGACKNSTRMCSVSVSWAPCPLSMSKELQLTQSPAQVPGNSCTNPDWLACRPYNWVEDGPPSVVEYLPLNTVCQD